MTKNRFAARFKPTMPIAVATSIHQLVTRGQIFDVGVKLSTSNPMVKYLTTAPKTPARQCEMIHRHSCSFSGNLNSSQKMLKCACITGLMSTELGHLEQQMRICQHLTQCHQHPLRSHVCFLFDTAPGTECGDVYDVCPDYKDYCTSEEITHDNMVGSN